MRADLPVKTVTIGSDGLSNTAILVASSLATSNSDARRKIEQKGFKINNELVVDPWQVRLLNEVDPGTGAYIVQFGKKIILVKPE